MGFFVMVMNYYNGSKQNRLHIRVKSLQWNKMIVKKVVVIPSTNWRAHYST